MNTIMKVGEVCLPDDEVFRYFKQECTSDDGWTVCYDKSACRVATKKNSLSAFDVVRVESEFREVSAELLYDVLHDGQYRSTWDTTMLEGYEICVVTPNSDIGYYSIKSPRPFKNRDFVTQRCWLDLGRNQEKYIINHSVNYLREPPRKNFVRGLSYLSGFLIIPGGPSSCKLYYMTQADPGGVLPPWFVNKSSKIIVPKIIKKLTKAASKYDKWKSKNDPSSKPWLYPEQMTGPRFNPEDIGKLDATETLATSGDADEANVGENAIDMDNVLNDD